MDNSKSNIQAYISRVRGMMGVKRLDSRSDMRQWVVRLESHLVTVNFGVGHLLVNGYDFEHQQMAVKALACHVLLDGVDVCLTRLLQQVLLGVSVVGLHERVHCLGERSRFGRRRADTLSAAVPKASRVAAFVCENHLLVQAQVGELHGHLNKRIGRKAESLGN